ncbi:glycoside hydrolase family 3 protein [Micromonospora sp. STR1_7]|uniref:Glycoside hydrolase family 3 protein n=1 Tax=Micromonospora parastrephiae TaxID=2806101 RepID=A0ABS1XMI6_9ACTN|nr:glycoside hydrolase family 3 protein [Micromonospora parastrephiae]MBM0230474.1 glycoside hydrolase family 3 protein [Micromonospora parastrephiae]
MSQATRTASENSVGWPPLLLSVNQEGGRLNALDWPGVAQLPGNLALGAAGDEDLAELAGATIGEQLRAVGLTWNLAPVCDTTGWPATAAVGARAFGSDPERVALLAAAYVRGLQRAGVAATAKHFPGLGGVGGDPHHVAPVVDRLGPGALLPFRAAIDAQVACVMVGSHTVLAVDNKPAFASPRVLDLLRDKLGFGGVVVSENLSIPAVHEPLGGPARAAVAAVAAGVDIVMLDSEVSRGHSSAAARTAAVRRRTEVVQALATAVEQGVIDRQRISEAVDRVQALHRRYGLTPSSLRPDWPSANAAAWRAAERIADRSVAVVRGDRVLPLDVPPGKVLALVRVPDEGQRRADSARLTPDYLPTLLAARHRVVQVPVGAPVPTAGPVILYGYDTRTTTAGPSRAVQEAARLLERGRMVVQVTFGDVDDLASSPAPVLVAAFSPHWASVATVARILLGDGRAHGVVPVSGASW